MCKTIKQKVKFKAPPAAIYTMLSDSRALTELTGKKAVISKKVGGAFSVLSGDIKGIVVDLAAGKRIVQAWRQSDFPDGIFSMAAFTLKPTMDGGTELVLTHRGVPKDLIPRVEAGWRENFWNRMRQAIESQKPGRADRLSSKHSSVRA
jgi:activator of HSP90 ATPase